MLFTADLQPLEAPANKFVHVVYCNKGVPIMVAEHIFCLPVLIETDIDYQDTMSVPFIPIFSYDYRGALRYHLKQQGQIQQISRAVDYVHQNLDKTVSIDELVQWVNMSSSGFHKNIKEVMRLSPLHYAKFIKLNKAQAYISDGVNASEAGFLGGYNSPAQFSRE